MNRPDPTIENLIPHRGAMCLLERIDYWDDRQIICSTSSHRRPDHPLREDSSLHAVHAIEYAAQAIALHRGLLRQREALGAASGMLAALRRVTVFAERLDLLEGVLIIRAECLIAQDAEGLYDVAVTGDDRIVLTGRLLVVTEPSPVGESDSAANRRDV